MKLSEQLEQCDGVVTFVPNSNDPYIQECELLTLDYVIAKVKELEEKAGAHNET